MDITAIIFIGIGAACIFFGLIPELIRMKKDAKEQGITLKQKRENNRRAYELEREKQKKLAEIETAFRMGDLTFAQYDALKAKYSGTESIGSIIAETAGVDAAQEFGTKIDKANAKERAKKEMTKKVILNAAIGDAVAGPAGAVIGAMTALNEEQE